MEKAPICFLFTCSYPTGKNETFLENEISCLSEKFSLVYVCPYEIEPGIRAMPENCKMVPMGIANIKNKEARIIALGFLTGFYKIRSLRPKKLIRDLYFAGSSFLLIKKIRKFIRKNNIDINGVVFYSYWLTTLSTASWKLRNWVRKKGGHSIAVSRAHGVDVYSERHETGYLPYQKPSLKNMERVFVCSKDGADYLKNKYPQFASKIDVAFLGTSDNGFSEKQSSKTFVTCSSLIPLKRVDLFAKAFIEFRKNNPEYSWVCFGDGEEERKIRSIVEENNCGESVIFKGRCSNKEVIDFYKKEGAFAFINVSSTEGLPVSVMEAMSFGIPCIATSVGGTPELVNNDNGVLLPPNLSVECLCEELQKFASLPVDERLRKSELTRKAWEEKVNANKNYPAFCDTVLGMLE